ncbi:flagellar motor protein MotA [Niveispirillum sp. BGYR6]|uniref:flagellar motor protein MotA n=1 Tax=Niveispirillum sp. BGYR6 TaxID=2971249 RepID=UPI0022B95AEE|nr:flagellar motor protein MotA [Niveispirillum sp. BGYR6]MDG5494920.1 flagellar motor protein MotA [Niveispirillum sp. BGYR6]
MTNLSADHRRPPPQPAPALPPATPPQRFLTRMGGFTLMVAVVAAVLSPALLSAFLANPALNALILFTLLLGIWFIFRQVLVLRPEVAWLDAFQAGRPAPTPRLLAPMARMLGERHAGRFTLSAVASRSLLDGVGSRLDEGRETSKYLIGLLIFLGLLGTFWGLLHTISSIGGVISGLSMDGAGDAAEMFAKLQQGLSAPLGGMGMAFSSSLFGLAGSLVLGFLELQASQAQNRFYTELEDWLAGLTRLSSGALAETGEGGAPVPAYLQALLEQTAENIERLQYTMAGAEDGRKTQNQHLMQLTERLATLTDQMRTEQSLMVRLAESNLQMRPILEKLADGLSGGGSLGIDDATRTHIRNLEIYTARILEETVQGRQQTTQELRNEIKILARTIAARQAETDR